MFFTRGCYYFMVVPEIVERGMSYGRKYFGPYRRGEHEEIEVVLKEQ